MARACELVLLAAVAVLLASTATAFTTPSCIKEAQQLVKVLDAKPQFYSDISTELKKLIKAVKKGYDVGEFYDSTLLLPTNQALKAAKINPTKIKNNEKLYRIHIFDGQLDSMAVGDVQMTSQPGVSVKVFKAPPSASPMKMAVRLVKSKKPPVPVLAHLHTGTGNCFEAYGIGGVLS
ncbi:unnamed protein product [Closterium sp. NIES-65]|nr:unnamed protein product [Closterium sp. NIES-65]